MIQDRSRDGVQPPNPGRNGLNLAQRFARGEALRIRVKKAIEEKNPTPSLFGEGMPRSHKRRIRKHVVTEVAREQVTPVDELVKDVDLAEAIDLIGLYLGKEAVNAVLSEDACLTQEQVIRLARDAWGGRSLGG